MCVCFYERRYLFILTGNSRDLYRIIYSRKFYSEIRTRAQLESAFTYFSMVHRALH